MRSSTIALVIVASTAAAAANEAAPLEDDTRPQHREWIRKLEMPSIALPDSIVVETDHTDQPILGPNGTVLQHRSWIKKLETPGGTLGSSL